MLIREGIRMRLGLLDKMLILISSMKKKNNQMKFIILYRFNKNKTIRINFKINKWIIVVNYSNNKLIVSNK